MSRKIKLDLHTHPIEAIKKKMGIKGIRDIDKSVASAIVKTVKESGLDGIAITEHDNFNHAWVATLEIRDYFRQENLFILPGIEREYKAQHFLQIFIPYYARQRVGFFKGKEWFLILAHPGFYHPIDIESINGIDIDAIEEKSLAGEFRLAGLLSQEISIPVIRSSNAHKLEEIGRFFIELELSSHQVLI